MVTPDNLDEFITCSFDAATCPRADSNDDGIVKPCDHGEFISAYFAGCDSGPPGNGE